MTAAESDASLGVTEPGLLGYHSAQAGLLAKAASYYRIAGGRSAERAAVAETRIYLERGLRVAGNLPEGPDRRHLEAELLIALGRILMATKGPSDPEAGVAFRGAVAVCRTLGSPEMLARALYSLGIIAETCAELTEAQSIRRVTRWLQTVVTKVSRSRRECGWASRHIIVATFLQRALTWERRSRCVTAGAAG